LCKKRGFSSALFLVAMAGSAQAAHCPHGQIYRIHLDECVSIKSALARAYVADNRHWRMFDTAPEKPRVHKDPPPQVPIIPVIPPMRQRDDPAPLDLTDGPVVTDKPMLMPELLVGMPPRWFICAKHPEWCQLERNSKQ
jgi:hypothetical protein